MILEGIFRELIEKVSKPYSPEYGRFLQCYYQLSAATVRIISDSPANDQTSFSDSEFEELERTVVEMNALAPRCDLTPEEREDLEALNREWGFKPKQTKESVEGLVIV